MSDFTPQAGDQGGQDQLTDEQRAFLLAQTARQAAESPNPAGAAADSASQMTQRGPLLPAEEAIDRMMALLKAQSDQIEALQAQVGVMAKQSAEALAAHGGPMVTRYAKGAQDKITAHVAANPDVPQGHFVPLQEFAGQLWDAAEAMAKGNGALADVEKAAGAVTRFINRTHVKLSGKHIDWSTVIDDVETVVDEAIKLAA